MSFNAKTHVALGQSLLLMTLLLVAALLGFVPDRESAVREGRAALAESIAMHGSSLVAKGDVRQLEAALQIAVDRNPDLMTAAVRRGTGRALVSVGDHDHTWIPEGGDRSTDAQVTVPIFYAGRRWGGVELRFTPLVEPGVLGFLRSPRTRLIAGISIAAFLVFYLYLGRMLRHLDPSQAVPTHVRSALDTLAEGLIVVDLRQRIVLANQAFAELLGRPPDELVGSSAAELAFLDAAGEAFEDGEFPWQRALNEGTPQRNDVIQMSDGAGKRRSFLVNSSPVLGSGGEFGGVLISLDDVTQLEESKTELSTAKEEAVAANRAKSDFLANMSHEIRTPMNAILGFTEVLKRGYDKGEADRQRHLDTIRASGEHLLQLINDVLDLSKVESGRLDVERLRVAPHKLAREVIDVLDVKAREKNLVLELDVEGEIPETILSDPTRLRQIMTNLISNAVKFTEEGAVRVVLRHASIEGRSRYCIDVIDNGIGIPPQAQEAIFEPFVQADSSVTRRFGGTGLGLPISRRFARALGGEIVVHSEAGSGSRFEVALDPGPLEGVRMLAASEALEEAVRASEVASGSWSFPPARVLVVDDGEENRELAQLVLEEVGLQVEGAENGRVGVDKVLAGDFDAVLMDMQMPVMDGYEATQALRAAGCEIPIIALTANAMKGFERECLDAGCTGFLTKPIDLDALLSTLAELLGGERRSLEVADVAVAPVEARGARGGEKVEAAPIRSRLADNPRLRPTVAKFVPRLSAKLDEMRQCARDGDLEELAKLAHWLKGSAGSVGFDGFYEPALALEELAKAGRAAEIDAAIDGLGALAERISLEPASGAGVETPLRPASGAAAAAPPGGPIVSRLASNPRFRPTVAKFALRLEEKVHEMEACWEMGRFEELAKLAHWLKGAAGTVGFDAFHGPAETLETLALEGKEEPVGALLEELRGMLARVEVPSNDAGQEPVR